jgi:hypothetical protein
MQRGVIVGTDSHLEWLLPWWWQRYEACNTLPVVFADFGMTDKAKKWCEEHGEVLEITESCSLVTLMKEWGDSYGVSYDTARKAWFKKALACLRSPFDETVWIDLDCEILSSIDPIFSYLEEKDLAIARTELSIPEGFAPKVKGLEDPLIFNGGVIVFRKESELIKKWVQTTLKDFHLYWGDDYILSIIVHLNEDKVELLPTIYNWRLMDGIPLYAKIVHWSGEWGKEFIAKKGGMKGLLDGVPDLKKAFEA